MDPVVVLFVRADSIYKTLPGVECYDAERDARTWAGGCPVVAHPPCRLWGRMRHLSTAPAEERDLAKWAIEQVRRWGGVLEHPRDSLLWPEIGLPESTDRDNFGGWTLTAPQFWWGHRARKNTRFYICGCMPADIPEIPFALGDAPAVVSNGGTNHIPRGAPGWRPEIKRWERDATPPALAAWLVELARKCSKHNEELTLRNGAKRNGGSVQ